MSDRPFHADGWYLDPAGSGNLRWWEAGSWTSWISEDSVAVASPLPPTATLPARAGLWGIVGALAAIVISGLASLAFDSIIVSLLVATVGLYGATTVTVWLVSRHYGTGNLIRDLGLHFRWSDLGGGIAAAVAARAVGIAALIMIIAAREQSNDDPAPGQFDAFETSDAAILVAFALAVLAAPFFEEIFFRGLIQSTLESRLGPGWAIAIASALFGAAHLGAENNTTANLVLFSATGLAGLVFGFAYWSTRRLGTAIIAHAVFNAIAAAVALYLRFR